MARDLPSGTVSFLFTDVEASTKLLQDLGAAEFANALDTHRRVLRDAFDAHGGVEVDTQGDAFFAAFPTAAGALAAAIEPTRLALHAAVEADVGIDAGLPLAPLAPHTDALLGAATVLATGPRLGHPVLAHVGIDTRTRRPPLALHARAGLLAGPVQPADLYIL